MVNGMFKGAMGVCAGLFVSSALVGCGESKVTTTPVKRNNDAGLTWTSGRYAPTQEYVHRCAAPRSGINPADGKPYPDQAGSNSLEKFALRSFTKETYLWASQLEDINPNSALNPQQYFERLKVEGDRFHFFVSSEENYRDFILGKPLSYGITWARDQLSGDIVAAYVQRNSPAQAAGIVRGDRVVRVDGVSEKSLSIPELVAALSPTEQSPSHTFVFKTSRGVEQPEKRLTAVELQVNSVTDINYFTTAAGATAAYFVFNSFNGTAEKELIAAINDLNQNAAEELILDLRFNGGGFLGVAAQLGYMLGGDAIKENSVFTTLRYSSGNPYVEGDQTLAFLRTTKGYSGDVEAGQPLPSLKLKRLYVLTSQATCSASESLMVGLRGVDFPVIQVGTTTCGKPFGMNPFANCGFDYYSVNFRYENAKGFSGFEFGLEPRNSVQAQGSPLGCEVLDQYLEPLGSRAERLLAAALTHMDSGSCPSAALAAARGTVKPLSNPNPLHTNAIGPRLSF